MTSASVRMCFGTSGCVSTVTRLGFACCLSYGDVGDMAIVEGDAGILRGFGMVMLGVGVCNAVNDGVGVRCCCCSCCQGTPGKTGCVQRQLLCTKLARNYPPASRVQAAANRLSFRPRDRHN